MDARSQKSEMTRAAIVGAAQDLGHRHILKDAGVLRELAAVVALNITPALQHPLCGMAIAPRMAPLTRSG